MNVCKILRQNAERLTSRPALIGQEGTVSFEDLYMKSLRLANSLAALGIGRGDRVAIMLQNGCDYAICYLALFILRAVAVPLDLGIKDELRSYLQHSDAKCLIAEKPMDLDFSELLGKGEALERIIYRHEQLADLIAKGSCDPIEVEISDLDPSIIFYTSGTTGRPKGVLWNYRHLTAPGKILSHMGIFKPEDTIISAIPFSHSAGLCYILCCLCFTSTVVIMDRFNPIRFLSLVQKHKVNCFFTVPAILEAILAVKSSKDMILPIVRWVAAFGSMSSPLLADRLQKLFANAVILEGYGLTETAPPTVLPALDDVRKGSVGRAPPWVEMRIVDEQDRPVPAGVVGEVAIRSWVVMVGYYRDPEMTATVMRNGWFHTGDMGKVDEDGYLFLAGRKKEMVIVGGLNVYPEEVEAVLVQHPSVREVAVIGVQDPLRGEKLKAVVVLKEGQSADREELISFCQRHLPPFKTPRIVEFADSLPKLASGKVARRALK